MEPLGCPRQGPRAWEVEGGQQCLWMSPQVPSEVWGADEQDLLLLLEPEEFLRGIVQLTQVLRGVGQAVVLLHTSRGAGLLILGELLCQERGAGWGVCVSCPGCSQQPLRCGWDGEPHGFLAWEQLGAAAGG